jgi:hypothetical protein
LTWRGCFYCIKKAAVSIAFHYARLTALSFNEYKQGKVFWVAVPEFLDEEDFLVDDGIDHLDHIY